MPPKGYSHGESYRVFSAGKSFCAGHRRIHRHSVHRLAWLARALVVVVEDSAGAHDALQ